MKNVILITDVRFWEQGSGHRARISALIMYLSRNVNLTVACTGPLTQANELDIANIYSVTLIFIEKKEILSSIGYVRKLRKLIQATTFDFVIIEYIHSTYFLKLFSAGVKAILDCHDLISDRTTEFKKYNFQGTAYELSENEEYEIMSIFDHMIVLCEPDYQKLKKVFPGDKVLLCPHPTLVKKHKARRQVRTISFLGSNYPPNIDGINYFLKMCWPNIAEKYEVKLSIYGGVCNSVISDSFEKIELMGIIEDLNEIYKSTDIIINPVRFGAGLKIKNVEAIANGLPLVTTSHGARGLEGLNGTCFLVANHPSEFYLAIARLIENRLLRNKLSQRAIAFAKKHFSAEVCFSPLLKVLEVV